MTTDLLTALNERGHYSYRVPGAAIRFWIEGAGSLTPLGGGMKCGDGSVVPQAFGWPPELSETRLGHTFPLSLLFPAFVGRAVITSIELIAGGPQVVHFRTCGPVFGDPGVN